MLIRIVLILVLFISNIIFCYSQNCTIKGKVISEKDSSAIIFASISFENVPIGTVTNEAGDFAFTFPDSINNKLIIACLGFESNTVTILKTQSDYIIKLKPLVYELASVSVYPKEFVLDIVKKAYKNITKNYPTGNFMANAFYRELIISNNTYKRMIEAAVRIQDFGYDANLNRTKINIFQFRKTDDNSFYPVIHYIFEKLNTKTNELYSTYYLDHLRSRSNWKSSSLLSKDFFEKYDFFMDKIEKDNNTLLYYISFKHRPVSGFLTWEGRFIINSNDFAILEIQISTINQIIGAPKNSFLGNNLDSYALITYQKYKEKYYLNFIKSIIPEYLVGNNKDWESGNITNRVTYLQINEILTNRVDYKRIKEKDKLEKDKELYKTEFKYDPIFWKEYNAVLLNPIVDKIRVDLEKEKPLDSQFKNHSK